MINSPNVVSDSDGYVQTTVVAPTPPGLNLVTLTAGAVTTQFSFTVPCNPAINSCSTTGTGGTGTGTSGSGTSGSGTGSIQQVTVVSGNGQLLLDNGFAGSQPLEVLVTDTSANPLPNVPVSFTTTTGSSYNCAAQVATDSNGHAAASCYTSPLGQGGVPWQTNVVTASTPYGSVTFDIEVVNMFTPPGPTAPTDPAVYLNKPSTAELYNVTGQAGVVQNDTFEVAVNATNVYAGVTAANSAIPNLSLTILNSAASTTPPPPATCANPQLSGANGIIQCNLLPGCTIGTFPFLLSAAGGVETWAGNITITKGNASTIVIVSGNNQSGNVGQTLPVALTAQVTDACGNPASGSTVTWNVTGSATLVHPSNTSDANGNVTTQVTLGQVPGVVKVTATLGTSTVTFQLTNNVTIASISLVSGGSQSVIVNQAFPSPLIFNVVDTNGKSVSAANVNFSITSGSGALSAGSGTTDANGNVSVTVTAGSALGNIVITATVNTYSATATLTVRQQGPSITSSSFTNYASGALGLVPCGLAIVSGQGLSAGLIGTAGSSSLGPYAYTVGGFSLTINNVPAPIQQISNVNGQQQAVFQTPCETPVGPVSAVATAGGTSTTVQGIPVYAAQPGIISTVGTNGKAYGAVVSVANGSAVTASNPLTRGQPYNLLVTGLGQVSPATATNSSGVAGENVLYPIIVGVDNAGVDFMSAAYQPGSIGIYAVEFSVPLSAPTGTDQPLAIAVTVNGQLIFGNSVYVAAVD